MSVSQKPADDEDTRPMGSLILFDVDAKAPTAFPYNSTNYANPTLVLPFGGIALVAILLNVLLLIYILIRRLHNNFISSRFIMHLCFTNIVGLTLLLPMFLYTLWTGENLWENNNAMCRIQAFLMCTIWSVINSTTLCIAGVHLLTFARIHYDQLFGLTPKHLCYLAWAVGFAVSLPCITNSDIVLYDPILRHCIWGSSDYSYKFLTYVMILGIIIPSVLSYYAYLKVLKTLYHSPIVFQSIGLYQSRFIVFTFLLGPLYHAPLIFISLYGSYKFQPDSLVPIISMFVAYLPSILSPILYAISLKQIKEEDMQLTARAHKSTNAYTQVHTPGHHL
ncbi:hypothetical protein M3Y94_00565100 [Aphelenchoides besseyi]|nr:hypothetical protein M3Y94_00565100 [Aphelenchoides besseyi]KAI6216689.1 G-PROTEIN-RECEP-F1-2 domain-containing protein [Aphelenchoides besseyi]